MSRLYGPGRILLTSSADTDAFGRVRVSNPVTVFDAKMQYDEQPLLFETATVGAGGIAHDSNEGAVKMTVGTASGDKVIRQSRRYCTYQPGKSQAVFITGNLDAPDGGCRTRIGYYDDFNGVFFERDSTGLYLVFRSSVTGATVDERVAQEDWNCDKLDCTGPSGKAIQINTSEIYAFDMQWLGVGRVRAGFDMDGQLICAHEFLNDNRKPSTYWTTATLPVRYEIENVSASSGATMRQICCSVQSEGGFDLNTGYSFAAANAADISVTNRRPVVSIRPDATFKGEVNHQGILPVGFEAIASGNAAALELVYNGSLTNASWGAVDTDSGAQFDTSATAITGGTVVARAFVPAGGNRVTTLSQSGDFPTLTWLTNSIDGTTTTPLTLVATSFVAQSSDLRGILRWVEIR